MSYIDTATRVYVYFLHYAANEHFYPVLYRTYKYRYWHLPEGWSDWENYTSITPRISNNQDIQLFEEWYVGLQESSWQDRSVTLDCAVYFEPDPFSKFTLDYDSKRKEFYGYSGDSFVTTVSPDMQANKKFVRWNGGGEYVTVADATDPFTSVSLHGVTATLTSQWESRSTDYESPFPGYPDISGGSGPYPESKSYIVFNMHAEPQSVNALFTPSGGKGLLCGTPGDTARVTLSANSVHPLALLWCDRDGVIARNDSQVPVMPRFQYPSPAQSVAYHDITAYFNTNSTASSNNILVVAKAMSVDGRSAGRLLGGGYYSAGDTCEIVAAPSSGYDFVYFTKNGVRQQKPTPFRRHFSFTVEYDTVIVGYFRKMTDKPMFGSSGSILHGENDRVQGDYR